MSSETKASALCIESEATIAPLSKDSEEPLGFRANSQNQNGSSRLKLPDWVWAGQIPSLNGLRALAVSCVILYHLKLSLLFPRVPALWRLEVWGHSGVSLFFVISGFLITLLLLRESKKTGSISLKNFYIRRACRILPAFYVFLLAVFILSQFGLTHVSDRTWVGALTYSLNYVPHERGPVGHFWSLCVEEHFYLLWPLVLYLFGIRKGWIYATICVVLAPILRFLTALHFGFEGSNVSLAGAIYTTTHCRVDSIALGCLLAYALTSARSPKWIRLSKRGIWLLGILATGILVTNTFAPVDDSAYSLVFSSSVDSACWVALVAVATICPPGILSSVLNARPVAFVGLLSYSIYLWQQPFTVTYETLAQICHFPYNVILVFLLASLSYFLIEQPFLRLKDRFNDRIQSRDKSRLTIDAQERAKAAY
jgi:peptidoglycan/LPS O-acetylase OafA/YrhL